MSGPATYSPAGSESSLARRYGDVRRATVELTRSLSAEDQMIQAMADASPTKWHLAHTTWFFETFILSEFIAGYHPFRPEFRMLFNSYYKQVGSHPIRATRGTFSRPSLDEVLAYRSHVDTRMHELLSAEPSGRLAELVDVGLNHEQQHQELIVTDILYSFWAQPLRPAYRPGTRKLTAKPGPLRWFQYPGGNIEIGHDGAGFAYDNETPRHRALLAPFRLASRLVTNGEYLEFLRENGYIRPELWLSEGWDLVCQQGWEAPLYWERDGDQWLEFSSTGVGELDLNAPVCHVSYFEADAYARWAGVRLPTENEWETAAKAVAIEGNFAESELFAPSSPSVSAESEPVQMFGDCWEWTGSPYIGYPGYRPAAGAIGEYNGKFMCNQFVLRGGSCATPISHIRATYRNFFPPHARWQFMGIRLAADEQ